MNDSNPVLHENNAMMFLQMPKSGGAKENPSCPRSCTVPDALQETKPRGHRQTKELTDMYPKVRLPTGRQQLR